MPNSVAAQAANLVRLPKTSLPATMNKHYSVNICRHYIQGSCKFGDTCMFPHSVPGIGIVNAGASTNVNGTKPRIGPKPSNIDLSPAQVCRFHQRGKCTKGRSCTFSHSLDEQSPLAPSTSAFSKSFGSYSRYQTSPVTPCRYFQQGTCREGTSCNYSHQTPENQPATLINRNNSTKADVNYTSKANLEKAETTPGNIVSLL